MVKNSPGDGFMWFLGILAGAALLVLAISYVCFRMAFYSPKRRDNDDFEAVLPPGETYAPYREQMRQLTIETRQFPYEKAEIVTFDGLHLYGKYYECDPSAPMEIMFPGYRGLAERDLCGGVQRAFAVGRNVLLVDQRACGVCEGSVITFGVLERLDCLAWIDYAIRRFGPDVKIVLSGVSMGAATVTMAAGMDALPENVFGVVADSGFTSPKDIMCKVIADMHLPPKLCWPFVRLGALVFGHFDPEAASSMEAVKHAKVPIFFSHGEADDFVPCEMTRQLYEACVSEKTLALIPGAGHGLCYLVAPDTYVESLKNAF
jgi:pimeloyl-ACP methyl ester carboxylesterase